MIRAIGAEVAKELVDIVDRLDMDRRPTWEQMILDKEVVFTEREREIRDEKLPEPS